MYARVFPFPESTFIVRVRVCDESRVKSTELLA